MLQQLIYALLGSVSLAEDSTFRALKKKNGEMLRCYRSGNWEGALKAYAACRTRDPGLGLGEFFNLYEGRVEGQDEVGGAQLYLNCFNS